MSQLTSSFPLVRLVLAFCAVFTLPVSASNYTLKGNDQIQLNVFGEPDLSREVRLTATGEASLPLIGSVELGGYSLAAAEKIVADLYRGDYLIEPRISINLMTAADQRVTVMGAVQTPGPVGIAANTTLDLASALSSAGGLAPQADPDRIELKRGDTSSTYSMAQLGSKNSQPVMLEHGDIISVGINQFANKRVTILGEVQTPGAMTYPTSGDLDLKTLVGMARGLTSEADPNRITIKRDGKIFSATLSENGGSSLRPGDLVTVPESRFVGKSVNVLGQVGNPGPVAFPLDGQLDILSAMGLAGGFDRLGNKKKVIVTRQVNGRNRTQTLNIEDMEEGNVPLFYLLPGDTVSVPVRRF